MVVSDACGGDDSNVLDNILRYASPELSSVLMAVYDTLRANNLAHAEQLSHFAQSIELNARSSRSLGRDFVSQVAADEPRK